MRAHPEYGYHPVGFIDDDPAKLGSEVAGEKVLGSRADIPRLVREHAVDEILIAVPSESGATIRRLVRACEEAQVGFKIVPGIREIILGDVRIDQIRRVEPEDLLGRESVDLDAAGGGSAGAMAELSGRTVLVTGAGGSIGGEICRQVLLARPRRLLLLGRGENSIFEIETELRPRAGERDRDPAAHRRRERQRGDGGALRRRAPGGRLPRRGAQARALHGALPGRGGAPQRGRDAERDPGRGPRRRRASGRHLHRQGGRPAERDGGDETAGRGSRARGDRAAPHDRGALRQRPRQPRLGGAALQAADRPRRPGDGVGSRGHALLHDGARSRRARHPGRRPRAFGRGVRPRHGTADPHSRAGEGPHHLLRVPPGGRHPDRVHRSPPRRAPARAAVVR